MLAKYLRMLVSLYSFRYCCASDHSFFSHQKRLNFKLYGLKCSYFNSLCKSDSVYNKFRSSFYYYFLFEVIPN